MTIALGILARDGLVLAADTQETYGEAWKGEHGKIGALSWHNAEASCRSSVAISGAGDGDYIDALSESIRDRCGAQKGAFRNADLKALVTDEVRTFHEKFVVPWNNRPNAPELQLLIAASLGHGGRSLLKTNMSVTVDAQPFAAVGLGAALANSLMARWVRMPFCDIYQTAVIAGMIVYQVKESIPAVGKNTDIFVINATDAFSYLSRETSRQIDVLAERYLRDLEPHHMRGLLGAVKQIGVTPATMTEDFAAMVAQIKTDIG